ncbi:hypothetical protein SSS_01980 [Sarcoptes scabiei]|uniref:SAYSvFN domain-containing protein n=1 Tax=Sarcoptes scabiei TaxID=52283 RepID=A0A834R0W2_SARSC|nr:hypothetical protein SSS_01980 [Sarcoptes scabiei]
MEQSDESINQDARKRLEQFNSSVNKLIQENDVVNIRKFLHQKYLQSKKAIEEDEENRKKQDQLKSEPIRRKQLQPIKLGKQLSKVFRFDTRERLRNRVQTDHEVELDPLLNDPNSHDGPATILDDDYDDEDDTIKSLLCSCIRSISMRKLMISLLLIVVYAFGQIKSNQNGFGSIFFMASILLFILINLRRKSPGELSAYSVFNPNFQSIPSVASADQPREQIVLGFGL